MKEMIEIKRENFLDVWFPCVCTMSVHKGDSIGTRIVYSTKGEKSIKCTKCNGKGWLFKQELTKMIYDCLCIPTGFTYGETIDIFSIPEYYKQLFRKQIRKFGRKRNNRLFQEIVRAANANIANESPQV